jgi:hypothetical protein
LIALKAERILLLRFEQRNFGLVETANSLLLLHLQIPFILPAGIQD